MNRKWFVGMMLVGIFLLSGCESAPKTVKNADEWIKTHLW